MAAFVDLNEYFAFAGGDDVDEVRAFVALEAACDAIRAYLNQTIDVVTGDVVTIHGTDTRALLLPELPIIAVNSITLDGDPVTDWTVDPYGLLWKNAPSYWLRREQYVVDYDHGYTTIPADIKMAAFLLTQRSYASAGGAGAVRQQTAGPFSVTYATDEGDRTTVLSTLDRHIVKKIPVP